jgi:ABC-type lipoprotein export system ATPase subunit
LYNDGQKFDIVKNLTKIAISEDNFFKMALIYIKMSSGIPVILMGETGIGKTALMELLSAII